MTKEKNQKDNHNSKKEDKGVNSQNGIENEKTDKTTNPEHEDKPQKTQNSADDSTAKSDSKKPTIPNKEVESTKSETVPDLKNPEPDKGPNSGKDEKDTPALNLPDGVTMAPRNVEEIHLDLIKNSPSLIRTYLAVSDDYGQLHKNVDFEKQIMELCEKYKNIRKENIENPHEILNEVKEKTNSYVSLINGAVSISIGVVTKYHIREGMLFNIEKAIVKKLRLQNWSDWFKENHPLISLRSAQDYMRIARIPNSIKFAFLTLDRLLKIEKVVRNSKSNDPIGDFLKKYGVDFDPEIDDPEREVVKDIKIDVDFAMSMIKINSRIEKEDIDDLNIDNSIIHDIVSNGKEIDTELIDNIILIYEYGGDVDQYLNDRYLQGGSEDSRVKDSKKVISIQKLIASFKSTMSKIRDDFELASKLEPELVDDFQKEVSELKSLIESS